MSGEGSEVAVPSGQAECLLLPPFADVRAVASHAPVSLEFWPRRPVDSFAALAYLAFRFASIASAAAELVFSGLRRVSGRHACKGTAPDVVLIMIL